MEIVAYDCGCVGFSPDENGMAIILSICDSENGEIICFSERSMKNANGSIKKYKPITETSFGELKVKIAFLIADGYKYREIRSLLR